MGSGFWLGFAQAASEHQQKQHEDAVKMARDRAASIDKQLEQYAAVAIPEGRNELLQRRLQIAQLDYTKPDQALKKLEKIAQMPLTVMSGQKAMPAEPQQQLTVPKAPLMMAGGEEVPQAGTNTFNIGVPKPPRIEDVPAYERSIFPDAQEQSIQALAQRAQLGDLESQEAIRKFREMMPLEVEKAKQIAEAQSEAKLTQLRIQAAKEGYKVDADGNLTKMTPEELSASASSKIGLTEAKTDRESVRKDLDMATTELRQTQTALNRMKADPNSPIYQRANLMARLAQDRMNLATANFYAMNYGTDVNGNPLPGALQLPDSTPVGRGMQANVRPTTPTRQMAETMLMLAPKMEKAIAMLNDPRYANQLGPIVGRWNEFMAGTVGSGNPDYIAIRSMVSLLQTAELRAHVGARGGVTFLSKFDSLNNANRMDADTLREAIYWVKDFLDGYSDYVFGAQGPMRGMKPGAAPPKPPDMPKTTGSTPTPAKKRMKFDAQGNEVP